VSSRATGDLAKVRKGDIDARALTKMGETYAKLNIVKVANAQRGDERMVVLGAQQQQESKKGAGLKQVRVRKEDGGWKVLDFK